MAQPELANTREVLIKRIRRLLDLERAADCPSELTELILPFLSSLGSVALIGGAIRDVARAGKAAFSSDLDFVIYNGNRNNFVNQVEMRQGIRNKFGGYRLPGFRWKIDVWHIEDTWAKTAGHVSVAEPADLLKCTFFDWDSVVYDIHDRKLLLAPNYLERLRQNIMDICLEENPNHKGAFVRALRRAALWNVKFGPKLTSFCIDSLQATPWEELVALDARAFIEPVLRYLDKDKLLNQLQLINRAGDRNITWPVPDKWNVQLGLPLPIDTI